MRKQSTRKTDDSSVTWHTLEEWIRGHVQQFIQEVLEQEVTDLLGGRSRVDAPGSMGQPATAMAMANRGG